MGATPVSATGGSSASDPTSAYRAMLSNVKSGSTSISAPDSTLQNIGSFAKNAVQPEAEAIAGGVRAIQATPKLASGLIDKVTGNSNADSNLNQANATMKAPIAGTNTFAGNTVKQNLGEGAQVLGQLAPEVLPGAEGSGLLDKTTNAAITGGTSGALIGGGNVAGSDPNATGADIAKGTLEGAGVGLGIGAGVPLAGAGLESARLAAEPTADRTASSVLSYIGKDGQKVFTKLTPEELSSVKDEVANIPSAAKGESQIHLDATTGSQAENGGTEVSRQKFAAGHSQAPGVLQTMSDATKPAVAKNWFDSFGKNKISPEAEAVNDAKSNVSTAEAKMNAAAAARGEAAPRAVDSYEDMVQKVTGAKSKLGTDFAAGAAKIESENPNLKLTLTNDQLDQLNDLKESKTFSLPDSLDTEKNPLTGKSVSPAFAAKNQDLMSSLKNGSAAELTPTQAQDLITQLNRGTFNSATGQVNQQMVDITNAIKSSASKTFGSDWDSLYSNYGKGINAVKSLDDVTNLDRDATASDYNRNIQKIVSLSKTPEGKILLQRSLEDFKNVSGIDLTDPVSAIQDIQAKQDALDSATDEHGDAQKNLSKAQRDLERSEANKGHSLKTTGKMVGRIAARAAIGGGIIYPAIRAIQKAAGG